MTRLYLRPLGLLWGEDADEAVSRGLAGRLAGGSAAFTLVEIITRDGAKIAVGSPGTELEFAL